MAAKHPLKALNVAKIDVDAARVHFDLPIEDQFRSKAELRQGLRLTKEQLLHLFGDEPYVTVFRGMTVPLDFVDTIQARAPVGQCWAWADDGALKGSGLGSGNLAGSNLGIILVAFVHPKDINWEFTVAVNTFHEDEKEIVVNEDAGLLLQKVLQVKDGRITDDILPDEKCGMEVTSS
jgi:hypothetical protein